MTKKEVIKIATPKKNMKEKNKSTQKKSSSVKGTKRVKRQQETFELNKEKRGIKNMLKDFSLMLKKHKVVFLLISVLTVLIVVAYLFFINISVEKSVINIDGNEYTNSDFMIHLYSIKYNYFGENNTDLSDTTLNTKLSKDNDSTVKDYLIEKTVLELKMATVIENMAKEYNIKLTKDEEKELQLDKEKYIKNIGGEKAFQKMLKHNNTTEKAYDRMSRTDKIYTSIYNSLYAEGKTNDLTDKEKESAKTEYYSSYKKIKQIILTIIDTNTSKKLSTTIINQKQKLANSILEEAKENVDFDELIKKYSEDAIDKEPPYDTYYKNGELLEELEKVVDNLNVGDISNVIETKYAFHIIQKQKLDDGKLNDFYEEKREEKLLKLVSEKIETISINYQKEFDNLKIK